MRNTKRKPRKIALTAMAVAALLVGPEGSKALKMLWDGRREFYPEPVAKGARGRAHGYEPWELVARAASHGDVSAEQVEMACRALELIAGKLPLSAG